MKTIPDCVAEKNRIQAELHNEYAGLSLDEQKIKMHREILSNPILAEFYSDALKEEETGVAMVAEEGPEYKTHNG